ncbi:hypothetical protein L0668_16785 [Paraglaciecola aquimarina]|uniref:STAS domain-containing protein n=1 Tax=Paraglaciecola algarum TaxID=3050085 RepID=A0ABS9DCM9_9ALTE|nr:hypothetical protein [Paraglaciecola sp. G1-23]MCF2949777.1 hypothetical protein [Paraglaciecola sp. G1-23]
MNYSFEHQVDKPNQILICEASGEVNTAPEMENMLKNIIKLSGKKQLNKVVFDVTALRVNCSSIEISQFLIDMVELNLLGDIKIARITLGIQNSHNLIAEIAKKLHLPIRNFESRSDALIWLLYNNPATQEE